MTSPLRNLLLSAVLIAIPVTGFTLAESYLSSTKPAAAAATAPAGLGDLSAFKTIVADTQSIAATGDLKAAEHRITDFETLWDKKAAALRQADSSAWSAIDGAADGAFSALRASTPDRASVDAALTGLLAALKAPAPAAASGQVQRVSGIAVTDGSGRALPCEVLIGQVRDALGGKAPSAAVAELQTKALERCNADDDAHADAYSAQALALIKG